MAEQIVDDDPFGGIKEPKKYNTPPPRDVNNFHSRADTDSSPTAMHHTLGIGHNQAAYGDHIHDGRSSKKLGQGLGLSVNASAGFTTEQKVASLIAMLHNVIEFAEN